MAHPKDVGGGDAAVARRKVAEPTMQSIRHTQHTNIQIDDIFNFKSNGKKVKIYYVKWSGSRLKLKKLTLTVSSNDKQNQPSASRQPTYWARKTGDPDGHLEATRQHSKKDNDSNQDSHTIFHDKLLINLLEQASNSTTSSTTSPSSNSSSTRDSLPSASLPSNYSYSSSAGSFKDSSPPPRLLNALELASYEELASVQRALERHMKRLRAARPQRLLLFVNPHGGKGKAVSIFKKHIKPLLELAQVEYNLFVTQHANHAREMIEDPKFQMHLYDGLVGVGGDGMFSELMNGLLFRYNDGDNFGDNLQDTMIAMMNGGDDIGDRDDKSYSSSSNGSHEFRTPPIPIGIISAGSTDANSFGFIGTNDVVTATLNIILGQQIKIDVTSLHSLDSGKLLSFASTFVAYGYFGDIIRESEKLRWLGPSRYDLTGFNNLLKHRSYNGHLRVLVSESDGSPLDESRCNKNCEVCTTTITKPTTGGQEISNGKSRDKLHFVELEGPFVGVNAAVTACRCPKTRKGFSPSQHLGNGCADLIVVRACSRLQYLKYLLRTGYLKKSPFELSYVDAFRCREFEFIPDVETGKTSSWNVDGEQLAGENSIRACVQKKLLQVYGMS